MYCNLRSCSDFSLVSSEEMDFTMQVESDVDFGHDSSGG